MTNKKIILVKYIEDGTIEGFVKTKEDFTEWLIKHNKRRKEEGELLEFEHEFKLEDMWSLF